MTKKIMKTLAVAMCAVLLVAGSIAGTMAYLTSETAPITNTFTAGNVAITLNEAKVNVYGQPVDANGNVVELSAAPRVATNEYKLIPGKTYTKDPTIHVKAGSEPCYLFVKVENGIADIEGANSVNSQMATGNKWLSVSNSSTVFYYNGTVDASNSPTDIDVNVFTTFTIDAAETGSRISEYAANKIVVTAYAVQAEGFTDAQDAWNKTFGAPQNGQ